MEEGSERELRKQRVADASKRIITTPAKEPNYSLAERDQAAKNANTHVKPLEQNRDLEKLREQGGIIVSKGPKGR